MVIQMNLTIMVNMAKLMIWMILVNMVILIQVNLVIWLRVVILMSRVILVTLFGHCGVFVESGGLMHCSSGRIKHIRVDFVGFHIIILTQTISSVVCS